MASPAGPTYIGGRVPTGGGQYDILDNGTTVATFDGSNGINVAVGRVVETLTVTNVTTVGAGTYTAAALAGGVITRDPSGGARTDTTDTAANIIAGTPALAANGNAIVCHIINTADAAETITLAGGTGVTLANAGQTLAQNESATLILVRASATTINGYIVGG